MTTPDLTSDTPSAETFVAPPQTPSWLEQDEFLKELWLRNDPPEQIAEKLGRSIAAIMTRAARLGLPRRSAPGRKPGYQRKQGVLRNRSDVKVAQANADSKTSMTAADRESAEGVRLARICLMCLKKFPSEGRHNRICANCKGSSEYAAGNCIPDIFKIDA